MRTKTVAIGTDGVRPVVAGLGDSRKEALADADENESSVLYPGGAYLFIEVTASQAERIELGEVECGDLGIDVRKKASSYSVSNSHIHRIQRWTEAGTWEDEPNGECEISEVESLIDSLVSVGYKRELLRSVELGKVGSLSPPKDAEEEEVSP